MEGVYVIQKIIIFIFLIRDTTYYFIKYLKKLGCKLFKVQSKLTPVHAAIAISNNLD